MDVPEKPVSAAVAVLQNALRDWKQFEDKGETADRSTLHRAFAATELVLRAYCTPQNFDKDRRPKEHIPPAVIKWIANHIAYIRNGYLHPAIAGMIHPGSPAVGPHEARAIRIAVAYIAGVRDGTIEDRQPVKTVSKFYGVTDRAVRRWQTKYAGTTASDFFFDVEPSELGELLTHAMKSSGLQYRQAGRGSRGRFEFPRPNKRPKAEQID